MKVIAAILILLFLGTISAATLNPVYHDEIVYLMIRGRYLFDGNQLILGYPQCINSYALDAPLSWLPVVLSRSIGHFFLVNHSLLRLSGLLSCLLWLTMWMICLPRLYDGAKSALAIQVMILAGLSLGVLPALLILARPEQTILFSISALAIFPIFQFRRRSGNDLSLYQFILLIAVYYLLCAMMFSVHAKSLLFAPLVLCSAWIAVSGVWKRIFLLSMLSAITVESYFFYKLGQSCIEDPFISNFFKVWTLDPTLLLSNPLVFFKTGLENMGYGVLHIYQILFFVEYPFGWLPTSNIFNTFTFKFLNSSIIIIFAISAVLILRALLFNVILAAYKSDLSAQGAILASLSLSLFALMFFENKKLFYHSALFVPLWILCCVFAVDGTCIARYARAFVVLRFALLTVATCSLISFAVVIFSYFPGWQQLSTGTQPLSTPLGKLDHELRHIADAAKQCDINIVDHPRHLVVDDLTYFYFLEAYQPFHIRYLLPPWGDTILDIKEFLTATRSAGLVTQCDLVPLVLRPTVKRSGNICCLPHFLRHADLP